MADHDAQVNLRVVVEGEDKVNSLATSLNKLNESSGTTAKSISLDTTGAAAAAGDAVKSISDAVNTQAKGVAAGLNQAAETIGQEAGTAIRSTMDKLKAGFDAVDWSSIAHSFGGVIGEAGRAAAAVALLGAAIGALGIAAAAATTVIKLMGDAMGYAQDLADTTIKNAGRAARAQSTLAEAEADSAVGAQLLGKSYDRLNDTVVRRLTDFRLGKGMRGDEEIFERLQITPESLKTEGAGRTTVLDMMERLSKQYADLQKQEIAAPTDDLKAPLQEQMRKMRDDVSRVFSVAAADLMATPGAQEYIASLRKMKEEAPSPVADEKTLIAQSQAMNATMFGLAATWQGLADQMGAMNLAPVTAFFEALRQKANEIGPALAQLGGAMAAKGWEAATVALQEIDVQKWLGIIQQWTASVEGLDAKGVAESVGKVLNDISALFQAIAQGVTAIMQGLAALAKVYGAYSAGVDFILQGNMKGIEPLKPEGKPAAAAPPVATSAADAGKSLDGLAASADTAQKSLDKTADAQASGGFWSRLKLALGAEPTAAAPVADAAERTGESLNNLTGRIDRASSAFVDATAQSMRENMEAAKAPAVTEPAAAAPAATAADALVKFQDAGSTVASAITDASATGASSMQSGISAGGSEASSTIQSGLASAGAAIQAALVSGGQSAAAAISASASAWGSTAAAALRAGIAGMSIPVSGGGGGGAGAPSKGPDVPAGSAPATP